MGTSHPHESAHLHVSGEATFVDDIPEANGTLFAALGLSQRASARLESIDLAPVRAFPGVIDVVVAGDIPGTNNCGPILADDPILAEETVNYIGQPVFAVVAQSQFAARRAARLAHIQYLELPAVLHPQDAKERESYVVPPMKRSRGDVVAALAVSPRRMSGTFSVGGQEQFYLEGQISYALPAEDGGLHLHCSTQHPSEMQHLVAHALAVSANQIRVETRRMGGGFGGKESQSAQFACIASIAARRLNRPVKLRLDRDDDMMITGKRHDFSFEFEVGFDEQGVIRGLRIELLSRAGHSADLSGPVMSRAVCHVDNAYYLDNVEIRGLSARTNTQSNTAFRGFGGPQGAIAIEYIIDNIARELGLEPLEVRRANFYGITQRNTTPYGMTVDDNVISELVTQLDTSSEYVARRNAIRDFNETSPILKKGIALTPVKFGISFNMVHYNQAGALVHVYTDGSVLVNHGGTEMGQGLNTKVAQVVATELGIELSRVRCTATDTSKVANTSATAASTGTDLNGKAAQDAARQIRLRLAAVAADRFGCDAGDVRFDANQVTGAQPLDSMPFDDLVRHAYQSRVQLWSDGFYATPKLHWDRHKMEGRPFLYFAYGAAVSEVVIDTLTGEFKLLRADLLHDAGNSINPAIDLGQIEGGFIQGMGWLTCEELWWNADGRLMTHAPSTYKIPAVNNCPADFRVALFKNDNVEDTIFRSKAVGEPPLLLAFSVFFAIRDAIASVADYRRNPPLNAPATPEAILRAVLATQEPSQ
jgi:xanthine dehydrogenase large subunit